MTTETSSAAVMLEPGSGNRHGLVGRHLRHRFVAERDGDDEPAERDHRGRQQPPETGSRPAHEQRVRAGKGCGHVRHPSMTGAAGGKVWVWSPPVCGDSPPSAATGATLDDGKHDRHPLPARPGTARDFGEFSRDYLPGWLGLELTDIDPRRLVARVAASASCSGPHGYLHGGSLVSIADSLAATARS